MFISFLYTFRATMCTSPGEITVSMWHLVLVILCGWQSSTYSDKYQVSHRHSYFSWWREHSRPKRVEKRNKHTKKNCAPSWLYLQDYTGMHSQQNIKKKKTVDYAVELGSGLLSVPCLWLLNNVFHWPEVLFCVCVCLWHNTVISCCVLCG